MVTGVMLPRPPRCVCCKAPVSRPPQPPSPLGSLALQHLRPPSSATWEEFLNASSSGRVEREFALLTLSDGEQRELYEAASVIHSASHRYAVPLALRSQSQPRSQRHVPQRSRR